MQGPKPLLKNAALAMAQGDLSGIDEGWPDRSRIVYVRQRHMYHFRLIWVNLSDKVPTSNQPRNGLALTWV